MGFLQDPTPNKQTRLHHARLLQNFLRKILEFESSVFQPALRKRHHANGVKQLSPLDTVASLLLCKSTKTLQAIKTLCENSFGIDAVTLARSILENQIKASYVLKEDSRNRAFLFEYYGEVSNLKKSYDVLKDLDPTIQSFDKKLQINSDIQERYEKLREAEKKKLGKNYIKKSWSGKSIEEMIKEANIPEAIPYYDVSCKFSHPNMHQLQAYFDNAEDYPWTLPALQISLQFYLLLLKDLEKHFGLELDKNIDQLIDERSRIRFQEIDNI